MGCKNTTQNTEIEIEHMFPNHIIKYSNRTVSIFSIKFFIEDQINKEIIH